MAQDESLPFYRFPYHIKEFYLAIFFYCYLLIKIVFADRFNFCRQAVHLQRSFNTLNLTDLNISSKTSAVNFMVLYPLIVPRNNDRSPAINHCH